MRNLAGFYLDDAGVAVSGATINIYARNTTTPVVATTSTNSSGYWQATGLAEGRYDVEIVDGSIKRRIKYDDEIQLEGIEVASFQIRNPADTFAYDIVPGAITAARTLNLPVITGTDTLAVLGLAQVFTAGPTWRSAVAGTGAGTIENTTDNASVLTGIFQGDRATPTDNDAAYISLRMSDSAGNQDEQVRLTWRATTVANGATQDGDFAISLLGDNALTRGLLLDYTTFNAPNDLTLTLGSGAGNPGDAANIVASGAVRIGIDQNNDQTDRSFTVFNNGNTGSVLFNISETAGASRIPDGIRIGADSTNNLLDDATNGAASATLYIGNASINVTSDARVKSNITPFDVDALALIDQLEAVEYDQREQRPFGNVEHYVGLTAQNVYRVAPWAVNTQGGANCRACLNALPCNEHLPWQVKHELLAGLFVKAIQQLRRAA